MRKYIMHRKKKSEEVAEYAEGYITAYKFLEKHTERFTGSFSLKIHFSLLYDKCMQIKLAF